MINRRACLQALAVAAAAPVGAAASQLMPSAAQRAEDLDLLEQALLTLHPGTRRYLSPEQLAEGLATLRRRWAASAEAADEASALRTRALALSQFLGTLRCGHTYTNFYNQRGAARSVLCLDPPRLPLHFSWLGEDAVVTGAQARVAAEVPLGSTLLSLNGQPMARLRDRLLPLVRADGHNVAAQLALLAPDGGDAIETFDVLHPLVFGRSDRFEVQMRHVDGQMRTVRLDGIEQAARLAMMRRPRAEASDAAPAWPLSVDDDGGAVLTMPGWAVYNTRWDWRAYLDRVFQTLQGSRVQRLAIDLRGNEGGLDCGDEILARLIDRPLDTQFYESRVRYRRVPAALNRHLDTWDDSFRDWGERAHDLGNGFFRLEGRAGGVIQPQGARFEGRVAVLVDGANHSATFRFVQLVQRHRLGLLVGGPTGGNQRGLNGGAFFFLRLPASGLEVDIPLIGTFANTELPDAGLLPDMAVQPTAADVAAGGDPVLRRAQQALRVAP